MLFEKFWPDIERELDAALKLPVDVIPEPLQPGEKIDEVLRLVRELATPPFVAGVERPTARSSEYGSGDLGGATSDDSKPKG